MATGPPQGSLPMMTPFPVASDPPTPKPIPDVLHPEKTPTERAALRFSLAGKRAIVTGGAQGLGLVCARALLEHGLDYLMIFDVDERQGRVAIEHLRDHYGDLPGRYDFCNVDVTDETVVEEIVRKMYSEHGIDLLICFAGITGSGSIVLTASMSGYIVNTPQPHPAYAVSKAGVQHLARSLAGEWVGHGIRVNSISPGIMNTRLSGGEAQAGLRRLWLERSPMGIGEPDDLTGAVVLLCSDASKFMTGTDIKLDGGYTIF
ncbi:MAG: hypothetical protein LQ342_007418 [Letrouitia transgressa]|nr:MAG: hypothetical protein LQ342_007418 [Letrouitia transgressa]